MRRFVWITDIHLNFLARAGVEAFYAELAAVQADGVLLSGDIGEAPDVLHYLNELDTRLGRPIYFVLGNHDFYRGSIGVVRQKIKALCAACPNLIWLSQTGAIALTDNTGLVGHDGWGDGRYGDYWGSRVEPSDWYVIAELMGLDHATRLEKLHALGDEGASHLREVLPAALERFRKVIVVTHVPPFREACWYRGRVSDDAWLPHFSCKAVGDVLTETVSAHPDRSVAVLCGHTHGAGEKLMLPNLCVLTGGAVYGKPEIQRVVPVE
jgi:hypothetical protein